MFWIGFATACGLMIIGWLVWYLAPLGCPETGAGSYWCSDDHRHATEEGRTYCEARRS